ncbi:MAG: hypothetical protein U0V48_00935 [Anaerolineales bacterium]
MKHLNLEALIEARDFASLRKQTANWEPRDIASLMEPLSAEKVRFSSAFCRANKRRRSSPICPANARRNCAEGDGA